MLSYSSTTCTAALPDSRPAVPSRVGVHEPTGQREYHCSAPLIAKMRNFINLEGNDINLLQNLCEYSGIVEAERVIVQEGSNPGFVSIFLSGLAYRYKLLPGGHRQILGYLVPGDLCDLSFTILDRADHSVAALVDSRVVTIPLRRFIDAVTSSPNVTRGLLRSAHLDAVITREWLLNVGQRNAMEKLSHLLCEMTVRLKMVEESSADGTFDFPLNQAMLADTVGLTPVHINRTLQRLRRDGLIALSRRRLRIIDMQRLAAVANFQDNYLKTFNLLK